MNDPDFSFFGKKIGDFWGKGSQCSCLDFDYSAVLKKNVGYVFSACNLCTGTVMLHCIYFLEGFVKFRLVVSIYHAFFSVFRCFFPLWKIFSLSVHFFIDFNEFLAKIGDKWEIVGKSGE